MKLFATLQTLLRRYKSFLIYSVIGFTGATLDYVALLVLFNKLGLALMLANSISVSLGITNNFLCNAFFNFKTKDALFKRFVFFYAVGIFGLLLSNGILWLFTTKLGFDVRIVKFLSIFIVVLVQYNLNKKLAFGNLARFFSFKARSSNSSNTP